MKLILLGAPGAGKGTQALTLSDKLNVSWLSSGDLFRSHRKENTQLWKESFVYIEKGLLVPDSITIKMVLKWIDENQGKGFILDGFPRNIKQAESLDNHLNKSGGIDKAIYISVPDEILINRLSLRLICKECGFPNSNINLNNSNKNICVKSGCLGELYQREDDKPESIKKRLEVFMDETKPLLDYYKKESKLIEIDGTGSINSVSESLDKLFVKNNV
ncbi:MAG: adenylate kinase [Chloroflexi bacterium]|jgi:adenylate kinase|nr:adenylate kinase [Chloroflexota bacterium]MCH2304257.1 adenylate kinase [SAR202 cluster bacterium]|tara:strand:- start:297 stop:950 length:654 start_codon:yes stop_codon:yes gene_type:complete